MAKKLYFYYGVMNSGKSTRIIQCAYDYQQQGMKVIVMKPGVDSKGENYIVSRAGDLKWKVDYMININENLFKLIGEKCNDAKLILIDEVQFLNRNQIDQLMDAKNEYDIPIMCYGLRTDFRGEGFEGSTRLLLIAEHNEEIKKICSCGCETKATQNIRLINGEIVTDGDVVAIDGKDNVTYKSIGAKCRTRITGRKFYRGE